MCRSMGIPVRTLISSAPSDRLPRAHVRPAPKETEIQCFGWVTGYELDTWVDEEAVRIVFSLLLLWVC